MNAFDLPAESSGEILAVEALDHPVVRRAIVHWNGLRGERAYPARAEILPRALGRSLRNTILVRVLDEGADYEYRIVGDAIVQGFNENFSGRRLSQIIADAPKFGLGLRMLYEMVRTSGHPIGYRGRVGQDMTGAQFVSHENAVLPFGIGTVDHLLIVTAITLRSQVMAP